MTLSLIVPHSANMPGYSNSNSNNKDTADLDEVSPLHSEFTYSQSYSQSSMAAAAGAMFSFPSTESWTSQAEGPQSLHDYPDSGSSHSGVDSGEAEDYIFVSEHSSPSSGSRLDHSHDHCHAMSTASGAEAMSRVSSSRSNSSANSQAHLSNMSLRANANAHANAAVGMDSCLLHHGHGHGPGHGVTFQLYWPDYTFDMGLHGEGGGVDIISNPLHVVPAQMHLGQDSVPETPSPSTWDCFSSSISRTSSPATIDEGWPPAPLSPASSSELCQSPTSTERQIQAVPENARKNSSAQLDDMAHGQPFATRRQGSDGESARDHALYKNVSTKDDGLFHCPWEGSTNCNHKPEKLKCNYDKFVDSHLKPYRCKAEACEGARFSSTACLLRHEREAHGLHGHGDKPFLCMYKGCERSIPGSGFPRQWNLRDHMKRVHNDHTSLSAANSPPPAVPAQQQPPTTTTTATATTTTTTKASRKRKSDASEHSVPSSRKASIKSMSLPAEQKQQQQQQQPVKPLLEQWLDQRKAVEDLLRRMDRPEAQQLDEVQKRLASMAKMAASVPQAPAVHIKVEGGGRCPSGTRTY